VGALLTVVANLVHGWAVGHQNWAALLISIGICIVFVGVLFWPSRKSGISDADGRAREAPTLTLIVHKATYGTASHCQDVTRLVRAQIRDNRLDFKPGTALLGDPFPNEHKRLMVDYSFEGLRLQKEFPQDNWVSIP